MKLRKWSSEEKMAIVLEGLRGQKSVAECRASIGEFIHKYNEEKLHQSLGVYDTPFGAYYQLPVSGAC